jgi:hypothetical protein
MNILAITVTEAGVLRTDVLVIDEEKYAEAVEFHHTIVPEIAQLDRAIKEKFGTPLGGQRPN